MIKLRQLRQIQLFQFHPLLMKYFLASESVNIFIRLNVIIDGQCLLSRDDLCVTLTLSLLTPTHH